MADPRTQGSFEPPEQPGSRVPCLLLAVVVLGLSGGAILLLAVGGVDVFGWLGRGEQRSPAVGQKPARLDLEPLTGDVEAVTLDDVAGQVVMVNFWGTWCPPCVAELPEIAKIQRKYRQNRDFRLLAVSCGRGVREDMGQLRAATAALLDEQGIDMPTYADPEQTTRVAFYEAGGFEGFYPTTLMLDRSSTIRAVWVGIADADELEQRITKLLREP